MKEQAVISTSLKQFFSANKPLITIMLLTSALFTSNIQAQQTALLDINGVPLTNEMLLLLSTGQEKIVQKEKPKAVLAKPQAKATPKKETSSKKEPRKSNIKLIKRNRPPNPRLEEDMLESMKAGKVRRVKNLLGAGISPTFKNYKGETPLGIAVSRGWASMVISLLENGANINEKGARGVTLLHVASSQGLTDVAKVLVNAGLDPSAKTDKNWTPLHVAARFNHWQLVRYFVLQGVDPDIRNSDGQTALGLARHLRHQGIIKILSRVTKRSSLDFAEINLLKKKSMKKKKRSKKRS